MCGFFSSTPALAQVVDSSNMEEEDGCADEEEEGDLHAAADSTPGDDLEHAHSPSDEQYATACGQLADEMRNTAVAPATKMFVPTENSVYING